MSLTLEQFVQALSESAVMSVHEISTYEDIFSAEAPSADPKPFVRKLVEDKKLTAFQASAILQDRGHALRIGDYIVLEKLGSGGMGSVFKAHHRIMKRTVAIKVLHAAATKNPRIVGRFYREVEAMAQLNHPNIVTAFDAGEHHGGIFLVMQFIHGMDIAHVLKMNGPLPLQQAVNCTLQAARGLAYAHDHGITHRDIKPGNLLVDADGSVKILDMGLARLDREGDSDEMSLTITGRLMGTVEYMAPEHAKNPKNADHRSDIYSLGCTMFRMLTGELPYNGETAVEMILAQRENPVPDLTESLDEVPEGLQDVFKGMLAKQKEDRYQSVHDLITDLEAVVPDAHKHPVILDLEAEEPRSLDKQLEAAAAMSASVPRVAADLQAPARDASPSNAESASHSFGFSEDRTHAPHHRDRPRKNKQTLIWSLTAGVAALLVVLVSVLVSQLDKNDPPNNPVGEKNTKGVNNPKDKKPPVWVDLLVLTNMERIQGDGKWKRDANGIRFTASQGAEPGYLHVPVVPTGSYKLELEFLLESRRPTESYLALRLPLKGTNVDLILAGGPEGKTCGLSKVRGRDFDKNSTTFDVDFIPGKKYKLLINVDFTEKTTTVAVSIDKQKIIEHEAQHFAYTVFNPGEDQAHISLISWKANCGITLARAMAVGGKLLHPEPKIKSIGLTRSDAIEKILQLKGEVNIVRDNRRIPVTSINAIAPADWSKLEINLTDNDEIFDTDLARILRALPTTAHLNLSHTRITPAIFPYLADLKNLRSLNLSNSGYDDEQLAPLATLTNLRLIDLSATKITNDGLAHLAKLTNLQRIRLNDTAIDDEGVEILLENRTDLTELSLAGTKISNDVLDPIVRMKSIQILDLEKTSIDDRGLAKIGDSVKFTELRLRGTKVTPIGVSQYQSLAPQCRITWDKPTEFTPEQAVTDVLQRGGKVWVHSTGRSNIPISDPAEITTEQWLNLGVDLSDIKSASDLDLISILTALKGLKQLNLENTTVTDSITPSLTRLTRLETLNLSGTDVTSSGMETLSRLVRIEHLAINNTDVNDKGLAFLTTLTRLQSLEIADTKISPVGLNRLITQRTQLKTLNLSGLTLNDKLITDLAALTKLQTLILSNVTVSNGSLGKLANIKSLKSLNLDGSSITDAGLFRLYTLTSLQNLSLRKTTITAPELARLKAALADTEILADNNLKTNTHAGIFLPGASIDLLTHIDPARDELVGTWRTDTLTGDLSVASSDQFPRLSIPIIPLGSYKLDIKLKRTAGTENLAFHLPTGNSSVMLVFGQSDQPFTILDNIDQTAGADVDSDAAGKLSEELQNDTEHAISIQVKLTGNRVSISASLNGQPYASWSGPTNVLKISRDWKLNNPKALGLIAQNSTVEYSQISLTMLNGYAHPLKQQISKNDLVANPAKLKGIDAWTVITRGLRDGRNGVILANHKGDTLASAGRHGVIRLTNPNTGALVSILIGHNAAVTSLAWLKDDKQLVSASADGTIRFWDIKTGRTTRSITTKSASLQALAISDDGAYIAAGDDGGTVRIWDLSDLKLTHTHEALSGAIGAIAFSPLANGAVSKLAYTSGGSIRIHDISGFELIKAASGFGTPRSIAWSKSGAVIAVAGGPVVQLWDVDQGVTRAKSLAPTIRVTSVVYSPDGKTLAATGEDGHVRILDAEDARQIRTYTKLTSHGAKYSVTWIPNADRLAVLSEDGSILLLDSQDDKILKVAKGAYAPLNAAAWDGKDRSLLLASRATDKLYRWNPRSTDNLTSLPITAKPRLLRISPSGKYVALVPGNGATSRELNSVQIYDVEGKSLRRAHTLSEHTDQVTAIAWQPQGRLLATAGADHIIHIWSAETGLPLLQLGLRGHNQTIQSLAWSPDGKYLLSGAKDGVVLWEMGASEQVIWNSAPNVDVRALGFVDDNSTFVVLTRDNTVQFFDTATGKRLRQSPANIPNRKLLISTDGRAFANIWHDALEIRDVASGLLQGRVVTLGAGKFISLSPNGHYQATPGLENDILYVAKLIDGSIKTLTPEAFTKLTGWKNDPEKVRLTPAVRSRRTPVRPAMTE